MQQNHCDGVLSNDWNTLLGQKISQHTAMSMSRSALRSDTKVGQVGLGIPFLKGMIQARI